jgi:signal peptidase I
MNASTGKAWKGLVASFVLWGAGQFFSGHRRRGVIWLAIGCLGPLLLLLAYCLPFVPGKAGILLAVLALIAWLAMLCDSYRPIAPLHWWGWILLIACSLTLAELSSIAMHVLFHNYHIPTGSMQPTLSPGDNILVSRYAYWFHEPARGDIVVFKTSGIPQIGNNPSGKEIMYDKRVIGLPGDRIELQPPRILVNGQEMKLGDPAHPIDYSPGPRGFFDAGESYVVPEQKYFLLGDNSARSFDSRYFGAVPREAIYGKVTKIYWPFSRMATPP